MKNIEEYLDQRKWLMEHGIVTDDIKNNLFMYGSIVHIDVKAVECDIDSIGKAVSYTVFVDGSLLKRIRDYDDLVKAHKNGELGLYKTWKFKSLLVKMRKKEERLDFDTVLNQFVKDYCGTAWSATVDIRDVKEYDKNANDEETTNTQNDREINEQRGL